MTDFPFDVLVVYTAIAIWLVLAAIDVRKQSYTTSIFLGIAILLSLNIGYLINGITDSIDKFMSND